jgi:hypothetical protein
MEIGEGEKEIKKKDKGKKLYDQKNKKLLK